MPQLERGVDELLEIGARQHAQDGEHAAGAGEAALEHLVAVDQEILAHGRHAERRQRARARRQILERAVEAAGLGEDRDGRGAGARIRRDARADVFFGRGLEQAHRRRTQLDLGDEIEGAERAAAASAAGRRCARAARAPAAAPARRRSARGSRRPCSRGNLRSSVRHPASRRPRAHPACGAPRRCRWPGSPGARHRADRSRGRRSPAPAPCLTTTHRDAGRGLSPLEHRAQRARIRRGIAAGQVARAAQVEPVVGRAADLRLHLAGPHVEHGERARAAWARPSLPRRARRRRARWADPTARRP